MKKFYAICLCVILHSASSMAQDAKILCDSIVFSLIPIDKYLVDNDTYDGLKKALEEDPDDSLIKYILDVKSYINVSENVSDSITFYTKLKFGAICNPYYNISVDNKVLLQDTFKRKECQTMFSQSYTISTDNQKQFKCIISYGISGTLGYIMTNVLEDNYPKLFPFIEDFNGPLYLQHDRMKYNIIKMNCPPDNMECFTSGTDISKSPRFNIAYLNPDLYIKKKYVDSNIHINLYCTDSLSMAKYNKTYPSLKKALSKINDTKEINIITAYWSNQEKRQGYGQGFGNSNIFLCDTSFLSGGEGLLHEILHLIYKEDVSEEPGKFVIGESMIEWISQYLYAGKFEMNPKVLKDESGESLYEMKKNSISSPYLIYNYGPYCIQTLADKIGGEELFKTIDKFLRESKTLSYNNFIQTLKEDFDEKDIENFDEMIKKRM